jgi:hypothetical protein
MINCCGLCTCKWRSPCYFTDYTLLVAKFQCTFLSFFLLQFSVSRYYNYQFTKFDFIHILIVCVWPLPQSTITLLVLRIIQSVCLSFWLPLRYLHTCMHYRVQICSISCRFIQSSTSRIHYQNGIRFRFSLL